MYWQSGRIAFDPPLPAARQDALAAIPTGPAAKVALAFAGDVLAGGGGPPAHRPSAPRRLHLRAPALRPPPRDRPSRRPRALEAEAAGPDAMAARALAALSHAFGTALRQHLARRRATAWSSDPHILGGYSYALPGQAHLRPLLAEPLGERLFFAGEALLASRLRHRPRRRRDRHRCGRGGGPAAPARAPARSVGRAQAVSPPPAIAACPAHRLHAQRPAEDGWPSG